MEAAAEAAMEVAAVVTGDKLVCFHLIPSYR